MQTLQQSNEAEAGLRALGFTELEARIYCTLLQAGPSTGYRLAKLCGKAPPNVYQALGHLTQKGVVLAEEGEPSAYRASAPSEVLAALKANFESARTAADEALRSLARPADDDRIYQIAEAGQVVERARAMLSSARQIVLFDLFPVPLEALRGDLANCAARGVTVAGLVYGESAEIAGVTQRRATAEARVATDWPGQQLTLVVDGQEHLVALMAEDLAGVHRALWSDSAYLSCLQHSGLSAEIRLTERGRSVADPLAVLSLFASAPAGLAALTRRSNPETPL
ncbi:helix-turn-helix domain-containing protein [Brevundimonas sp.]|uniref:TrmB family transcriptional regulator n=1 Tax=Brevundimonas sp. TaxID=1871086 RepID=UPI001D95F94D|nr:helix-turn-helix domain-containing protein [Brevundimonas sp.]MBL0947391.1 TrmB family transcriptional regulator [Brevundimonas sp.]